MCHYFVQANINKLTKTIMKIKDIYPGKCSFQSCWPSSRRDWRRIKDRGLYIRKHRKWQLLTHWSNGKRTSIVLIRAKNIAKCKSIPYQTISGSFRRQFTSKDVSTSKSSWSPGSTWKRRYQFPSTRESNPRTGHFSLCVNRPQS